MLGTAPGAGTQQETEPTPPCLLRPRTQPGGHRQTGNGWFTRWCDGQARQKSWGGESEWCAGLSGAFLIGDLAGVGFPLITARELTGSVHSSCPDLPLRSRVLPSLVSSPHAPPGPAFLVSGPCLPASVSHLHHGGDQGPSTWGCREANTDL